MSWRATAAVKDMREGLNRSEKFLLLILADYHNAETGQCDPSLTRLGHDALMSTRAAQIVLKSLEAKRFIRIIPRTDITGRTDSNQYDLICLTRDLNREGEGAVSSPSPQAIGEAKEDELAAGEGDPPIRGRVIVGSGGGRSPDQGEGDPPIARTVIEPQSKPKDKPQSSRGRESAAAGDAPELGISPAEQFARNVAHQCSPEELELVGACGVEAISQTLVMTLPAGLMIPPATAGKLQRAALGAGMARVRFEEAS